MKRKYVSKISIILFTIIVLSSLFAFACSSPAPAPAPAPAPEPIVLKAITWPDTKHVDHWEFLQLNKLIEEKTNGAITVKYVGSDEVIPKMEMLQGIRQGVVDMGVIYGTGATELIPGMEMLKLSRLTPEQEREVGFEEFLRDKGKDVGVYYVGRLLYTSGYFGMFSNNKLQTPEDFKGEKIALIGWTSNVLPALGCVPVAISSTEYYTALERGMCDGFLRSFGGTVSYKLYEVCKYIVGAPLLNADLACFFNLDTWNKFSSEQQKAIHEAQIEVEAMSYDYNMDITEASIQTLIDNGMERVTMSAEDEEWFIKTGTDGAWEYIKEVYPEMHTMWHSKLSP